MEIMNISEIHGNHENHDNHGNHGTKRIPKDILVCKCCTDKLYTYRNKNIMCFRIDIYFVIL